MVGRPGIHGLPQEVIIRYRWPRSLHTIIVRPYPKRRELGVHIDSYVYIGHVMSHASHIGPTCGAVTDCAWENMGVGLLLNGTPTI